ncbi:MULTISPECIES: response regulator [Rhodomicrobium]|uniref:response regulator n=1 Tax=Rhodomicrobium TaxID=1068 RepID=UPI000B4AEF21|nr:MULTISPECIES: response regulator [Rhodomicrobium]
MRHQPLFLSGIPVLVVEDDVLQALDLSASLAEAGALPVGPAATVGDALQFMNAVECRAVVLDLRLRGEDGTWLAWELYRRRVPFVVHTGYMETRFLPAHWPGCQVMFKPASMDKLTKTLAYLIRWKRMAARGRTDRPPVPAPAADSLQLVRAARVN